jgi:nucleoside-diphosphate-sugar epimerase
MAAVQARGSAGVTKKILITGATGYLGSRIAEKLASTKELEVIRFSRAESGSDLTDPAPFKDLDPSGIIAIIHCAAVTKFNVDEETAKQVNVEGTQKVIDFATKCDALEHFHLLSTIYASGLRPGLISEERLDDSYGFANNYEHSKWQSEQLLHESKIPYSISRVATVIADDESGVVTQQNAFHNTLKLFYYGLMSVVPGKEQTPLYFVTGDFATKAICAITLSKPANKVFHVSHTREESAKLAQLIDISFEEFNKDPAFAKRRVLKPLYCDADSFTVLAEGMVSFGQGIMSQAVSSVSPFSQQLFIDKDVRNNNIRQLLAQYEPPEPEQFIRNTCHNLLQTRWGRESVIAH